MKKKKVLCNLHNIPLIKRQTMKEGESRYFCIKCKEEENAIRQN